MKKPGRIINGLPKNRLIRSPKSSAKSACCKNIKTYMQHKTVLSKEAIDGLEIKTGDVFVDGTLGGGGHLEEVARRFGGAAVCIGIDLDPEAIERATVRLESFKIPIRFVQGNFRNIDTLLKDLGVSKVDKILFDIGLSSNQFEDSGR